MKTFKQFLLEDNFNQAEYLKWKRKNITLRGMKQVGEPNGVFGSYGKGLYTVPLSNRVMAKQYGDVFFVINAIPKKPKIVDSVNGAEIFKQNVVAKFCKEHNKEYDLKYFEENTTFEKECLKLGFDGLIINGRELVNFKPENIKYFKTEAELQNYYKYLKNNMLLEYVSNEIIDLRNYINQTDEQKIKELPFSFPEFFQRYLEEIDYFDYKKQTHDYIDSDNEVQTGDEYSDIEEVEYLSQSRNQEDKKLIYGFGKYLLDRLNGFDLNIPDTEYPSWVYFERADILKNQWLIHFTNDDVYDMSIFGFKKGVNDYTKLGLTKHVSKFDKQHGGYNFAYRIEDFEKYAHKISGGYKYGEQALLFQGSGIKTYHVGDEEPQVIFWGKFVKNIIPIYFEDDYMWTVKSNKTDKILFKNEELPIVVNWIVSNFNQYHKHLVVR